MSRFYLTSSFLVVVSILLLALTPNEFAMAAILCLLIVFLAAVAFGVALPRLGFFGQVLCRGPMAQAGIARVALTFDDGPDPNATPALLRELERLDVKATFFLVGDRVLAYPDIARQIAQRGHQIGNHSQRHHWAHNFLAGRRLTAELSAAQLCIARATGQTPRFYRPPVGLTNPHLFPVLKKLGLHCVAWDIRTFDKNNQPRRVVELVLDKATDGSIVLLHDHGSHPQDLTMTVRAMVEGLAERGFRLVRLDELAGLSSPPSGLAGKHRSDV